MTKIEKIKELIRLSRMTEDFQKMLDQAEITMISSVETTDDKIFNLMQSMIKSHLSKVTATFTMKVEEIEKIYDEFSEEELDQMIQFFQSAVGIKLMNKMPAVQQKLAEVTFELNNAVNSDTSKIMIH